MGKGARSRANNAVKKAERKAQDEIQLQKSKKNKLIIKITAAALAVIIAFSSIVYVTQYASGKYLRNNTAAVSMSYEIDNAVMTYLYKSTYVDLQTAYSGYFEMFTGVDTSITLQKQYYDTETTWFDYVLSLTQSTVSEILALAEMANLYGLELTDEDYEVIDANVAKTDSYFFEDGVKEEDVRTALELSALAQKYVDYYVDDLDSQITTDILEEYYSYDESTYQETTYYYYSLTYDTEGTEGEYTQEEALAYATAMYEAASVDEYIAVLTELINAEYSELTEENLELQLSYNYYEDYGYTADDEISIWIFDEDAQAGETYLIEDEENLSYSVCYLVEEAARNESESVEFAHILLTLDTYITDEAAATKAEEIIALYNENPTQENFEQLAKLYSEDTGSASYGGSYSGVAAGDMVTSIDSWCFDETRVTGDIEIVESDYGYHIMYYINGGTPVWEETVKLAVEEEAYTSMVAELVEIYTIMYDYDVLYQIPC